MKIIRDIKVIRDGNKDGYIGDLEAQERGDRVLDMLKDWGDSLPLSFLPVEPPALLHTLDIPLLKTLDPLFYSSTTIAIAMGSCPLVLKTNNSSL